MVDRDDLTARRNDLEQRYNQALEQRRRIDVQIERIVGQVALIDDLLAPNDKGADDD